MKGISSIANNNHHHHRVSKNGPLVSPYGDKSVKRRRVGDMKFTFRISPAVATVVVFLWCAVGVSQSRINNEQNYLEYLNDLDRRNVEFDDLHRQWPFFPLRGNNAAEDAAEAEAVQEVKDILDAARSEYATKHNSKDRTDHLNQYVRYKPYEQEPYVDSAKIYGSETDSRIREDDDDDGGDDDTYPHQRYDNSQEDEILTEPRPRPLFPSFPRIAPVEKPYFYETPIRDSFEDTERILASEEDDMEILPPPRPSFSTSFFPRIAAPMDFGVNYKIDDDEPHHHHQDNEEYRIKQNEEFPHRIDFDEVPILDKLDNFAVGPADPRFYREDDIEPTVPPRPTPHPYLLTPSIVSKPKMNSRSDQRQQENQANNEETIYQRNFADKDVEVRKLKAEVEEDTAGLYIIAIVAGISAAATVGLIAVGIGWYKCVYERRRNGLGGCIGE